MLKYQKGDLFKDLPINGENEYTLINHIVNNCGSWGAGFVLPLEASLPGSKLSYQKHLKDMRRQKKEPLGTVDYVEFLDNNIVCNLVAQNNKDMTRPRLVDYGALAQCMARVRDFIELDTFWTNAKCKIVCPMMGAGIGMGDFSVVEDLINWFWKDFDVTVYKL